MPHPQLQLTGSAGRREKVDRARIQALFDGELELDAALGADASDLASLRRQAVASFEVGRHADALRFSRALFALGSVEIADVVLVSMCYEALGDRGAAARWEAEAERLLGAMEELLSRREGSR